MSRLNTAARSRPEIDIRFKEDRIFMSRLIVAARSRGEIGIIKCFGHYEFSVVPKSLFQDDWKLVRTNDKYVILQELEDLYPEINFTTSVISML